MADCELRRSRVPHTAHDRPACPGYTLPASWDVQRHEAMRTAYALGCVIVGLVVGVAVSFTVLLLTFRAGWWE